AGGRSQPSRLRAGRPAARAWKAGSTKSGPTLKGATVSPSRRSATVRPSATLVFPTPECVPATTSRGTVRPLTAVVRTGGPLRARSEPKPKNASPDRPRERPPRPFARSRPRHPDRQEERQRLGHDRDRAVPVAGQAAEPPGQVGAAAQRG